MWRKWNSGGTAGLRERMYPLLGEEAVTALGLLNPIYRFPFFQELSEELAANYRLT